MFPIHAARDHATDLSPASLPNATHHLPCKAPGCISSPTRPHTVRSCMFHHVCSASEGLFHRKQFSPIVVQQGGCETVFTAAWANVSRETFTSAACREHRHCYAKRAFRHDYTLFLCASRQGIAIPTCLVTLHRSQPFALDASCYKAAREYFNPQGCPPVKVTKKLPKGSIVVGKRCFLGCGSRQVCLYYRDGGPTLLVSRETFF